jgi:hypothetical protein
MTEFCKHGNERAGFAESGEFLNQKNDCGLDAFVLLGSYVAYVGSYQRFGTIYRCDREGSSSPRRLLKEVAVALVKGNF